MIGIFKSSIQFYFDFSRILDVHKTFLDNVSKNLFELYYLNKDFLPTEILKDDKIIGQLTSDLTKVMIVWLWLFRNYGIIIKNTFSNINFDVKKHNVKIYTICLKLCNIKVPNKLSKKRKVVIKHKQLMASNS